MVSVKKKKMFAKNEMRKLTIPTNIYLFLNVKVYEIGTTSLSKILSCKKLKFFFKHNKAIKNSFNIGIYLTLG